MGDTPNLEEFSVVEKKGEYQVFISFSGVILAEVKAGNLRGAEALAQGMIDDGDLDICPEDLKEALVLSIKPCPPMYRVNRDGRAMRVARVLAGDTPRSVGAESEF